MDLATTGEDGQPTYTTFLTDLNPTSSLGSDYDSAHYYSVSARGLTLGQSLLSTLRFEIGLPWWKTTVTALGPQLSSDASECSFGASHEVGNLLATIRLSLRFHNSISCRTESISSVAEVARCFAGMLTRDFADWGL